MIPYIVPIDWINPLMQLTSRVTGGQGMTISMPESGMTPHEVCDLLRANGVGVSWGGYMFGTDMTITVSDRERAVEVLEQNGFVKS